MDDIRDTVKLLYKMKPSVTIAEAADITGISVRVIKKIRKELGMSRKYPKISDEKKTAIVALANDGMDHGKIARFIGVQESTVELIVNDGQRVIKNDQIRVVDVFEKTIINRLICCTWNAKNIQEIFTAA